MRAPIPTLALSQHTAGVIFITISAVAFSSAGIFTRGVEADAWSVIFWRGLSGAGFILGYLAGRGQLWREVRAVNGPAIAATVLLALGAAAFITAFKYTSVANVTVIYATTPFLAAGLSWIALSERPSARVMLASTVAFGGIALLLSDEIGAGSMLGNALSVWMSVMVAGCMVVYRRWPSTSATTPVVLSSILVLPTCLIFGDPLTIADRDLVALIAFGFVFSVSLVAMNEGARRLPSAENALLSTMETPLALVLAYLILSEVPTPRTMVGASIVLAAVLWSQTRRRAVACPEG
ncbi:EamA family transporter [Rhodospirillaceae bacterium KN72]|uniref:EamA family transporter n=1 Tax=Pacificispira spongiicola TaxID=2729598 RepID=A0A7Y0DZE7_9PROT|nr:DMT family transporter [Pacificispira spongiicola]NMM44381.1 EamA family transporter [Pacificispira spongiicola]